MKDGARRKIQTFIIFMFHSITAQSALKKMNQLIKYTIIFVSCFLHFGKNTWVQFKAMSPKQVGDHRGWEQKVNTLQEL